MKTTGELARRAGAKISDTKNGTDFKRRKMPGESTLLSGRMENGKKRKRGVLAEVARSCGGVRWGFGVSVRGQFPDRRSS